MDTPINAPLRKLPIGIQSFEKLRSENFLYVDKTALIYRLAQAGNPCFLSRPRRFGKSLLLSSFEAYFQGKKELFRGLAIEKLEKSGYSIPCCISASMRRSMTVVRGWSIYLSGSCGSGKSYTGREEKALRTPDVS